MEKNTLEIEDDINHHKLFWKIKRVVWILMFCVIILALLGYTGGGLSSEVTITGHNISVSYQKYSRAESIVPFKVKLENIKNDTFSVQFSNNYLEEVKIEGISPIPAFQKAGELVHTFYFIRMDKASTVDVCYYFKALDHGYFNFAISSDVGKLSLKQLILP